VIVAYNKSIVMEETLEKALDVTFGENQPIQSAQKSNPNVNSSLVRSALETYRKSQDALRQGNWTNYGQLQQALETILQQLNQQ
jgi:uncharacterized protein